MAKQYKIKINGGPDNKQVLDLEQGSGDRGQMVRIKAVAGVRYQLEDAATGFAPENIRAKRVGKDLRLSFEGGVESDFLIEDYYEVMPSGYNAVIGQAENGRFYEYIPESASGASSVQALGANSVPVGMALGGSEVQASGAAVGVLVAAAGLNPLLLAPLGLLGLAGGGGGGSSPSATPVATAHLTANATNDTGLKSDDGITSNNHPEISGTATPNSAVSVTINNKTYTTTAGPDGIYQIQIPATDTLPDGVYPVKVAATLNGKTSDPIDGTPIIVDTSSSTNYSPGASPIANPDANVKAMVAITSIVDASTTSADSGANEADFITKDNTLTYKGTVTGYTNNGDALLVQLMDANNVVIAKTIVTPDSNGTWRWNKTAETQADGVYTLVATVVDPAGNAVNPDGGGSATQKIVIDSSSINNYAPDATPDVNVKATVDILAITPDSGVSNSDFVTNSNALKYTGKVTGFTPNGDVVLLELKDNLNTVVASKSVNPDNAGNWAWDDTGVNRLDGSYTLKATIVDLAGNTVNATVPVGVNLTGGGYDSQKLVIDTSTSQNYAATGVADANVNAVVKIISITDTATKSNDTGTYGNDFITSDQTLSYKGTVVTATGAILSSAWVQVELKDASGVLKASNYVQSDAQGNWLWNNTGYTTPEGKYTICATVVDDAGNKVNTSDSHPLTVDLAAPTSAPTNIAMTDTGSVANGTLLGANYSQDWITNSPTFSYTFGELGQGVVTQFSLDSGKSWTTASSFPIDLVKDGVPDGTYAELQIKNLDAAGNPGPAAIYAHPFTIDTKAPVITHFALDTTLKTVGFSVDESGWYSYTITDAANHASDSAWTYLAVSPGTTSNVSISLASGSYAAAHFQLNYQDVAGNMVHQSNATDWTLSAVAPSTIPLGSVQSSSLATFQLTSETSLDLFNVSGAFSLSQSSLDTAVGSGVDMLTLKLPDLLSQTSGIATVGMASSMLGVSIEHYNLVTLHDLVSTSTAGTWGVDSHLGSAVSLNMYDPMADLLVHQASLNVN